MLPVSIRRGGRADARVCLYLSHFGITRPRGGEERSFLAEERILFPFLAPLKGKSRLQLSSEYSRRGRERERQRAGKTLGLLLSRFDDRQSKHRRRKFFPLFPSPALQSLLLPPREIGQSKDDRDFVEERERDRVGFVVSLFSPLFSLLKLNSASWELAPSSLQSRNSGAQLWGQV